MSARKLSWTRNTSGLEASAKRRAETTRLRVDEAIAALLRDPSRRVNFNTVAAAAGVAKAYLYKEPVLRSRIDLLRQRQDEARRSLEPARKLTAASNRLLVAAKDRRIRELELRVKELEGELAVCRGKLYDPALSRGSKRSTPGNHATLGGRRAMMAAEAEDE